MISIAIKDKRVLKMFKIITKQSQTDKLVLTPSILQIFIVISKE